MLEKSTAILKRIEAENEMHDYWIVGPVLGRFLYSLTRKELPEVVLEIGTSVGYSAIWFARALEKNGKGKIWTIESNEERFEKAKANFEASGLGHRIIPVKGHAPDVIMEGPSLPSHVDLAFFDATKKETRLFFDAVFPRMESGGLIVVDNVISHRFEMMKSFLEFVHQHPQLDAVELGMGNGLLLARIK